uniref:Uncharacterized protein n=1 Tax=Meloidogyne enterolobii TaxID=390850 RepID=A0A6V7UTL5_MELEN|nr:unnamed protein product [Meloidogyne enterolobii]
MAIKQLILNFDEFCELIKQRGSKSQIIQLFELDYNNINSILESNDAKTNKTMNDFVFTLLKKDEYYLNREKLFEWLYEDYVQALDTENIEERNCAIASSAIILNILWLDNYFPKDLEDFWKQVYRPMLLLYVDKLKQNKIEIIKNYLHKFLSMLLKLNYFINQIYETRDKGRDVKRDILNEEWPLNYETQQQLFEYDQLSNEDQIKEDKIVVDLKAELNKLIESLDKNDQINSKDEDIEDFREFIYYRHSWVISNLINPEFQEKVKGLDTRGYDILEDVKNMSIDDKYLTTEDSEYYNKYNPIEFVCPEGQQYENLTNNEPAG